MRDRAVWRIVSGLARGVAAAMSVLLVYLSVTAFVELDTETIQWVALVVLVAAIAFGVVAGMGRPPPVRRIVWPLFVVALVTHLWAMYVVFIAPHLGSQRIERPEAGFALELPTDWEYVDAAAADPTEWWRNEVVDDVEAHHDRLLAAGLLLLARGPDAQSCLLFDHAPARASLSAWSTLEDAEADLRDGSEGQPAGLDFWAEYHDLPAGRVLSVDQRWQGGTDQREYLYTDGEAWFGLRCATGIAAAEDRWLSIAETFEFLPAEGS